ncbi:VCBS repeat-containing protein [Mycolicibacterium sp. BK634]|uniref:Ig-like domain-containing protein n=1 Tax=Mycolicibacterium sp. BK634 TaxID=2587099 RepID=UPI0016144487|nr:Ig-like domain-containing protein [Mycolicibacterium sp. BK634]MBB3751940.1 VCBS repeat-containing protein [Mycolicibacterium sp. BK634]
MISPTVEKSADGVRHAAAPPTARGGVMAMRAIGAAVLLALAIGILTIAFALPAARSKPHDVPIGVAGSAGGQMISVLQQRAPGVFRVTTYADVDALHAAIRNRDQYGGISFGPTGPVLLIASGASPAVAQSLTQVGNDMAKSMGVALHLEDLAPPTAKDSRGSGLVAAGLPITVAGLLPAIVLILLPPRNRWVKLAALLLFSVIAAVFVTLALGVVGAIDANFWGVASGLLLGISAAGLTTFGLGSLFGRIGLIAGSALGLLLGNPLSGLASAPEMLPSGWGAFGQYLPQGATASLLRSSAFFDGAGAGSAITVLIWWVICGSTLFGIAAFRTVAAWLGVGAITLGIGAALAAGSSVAHADTARSGKSESAAGANTGPAAPGQHSTASAKSRRANPPRPAVFSDPRGAARQASPSPGRVLSWVRRVVGYTLFNKTPAVAPVQQSQDPLSGVVTGDLHGSGGRLTYTVNQPENARVHVNPDGTFTVTPDSHTGHLGGTVTFTVVVDNGGQYRLPGPLGRLQAVIHSLARRFGLSGADTVTTVVTVDIAATNKPPAISGYTGGTSEADGSVSGQIQAADPNQDSVTFTGTATSALGGVVTINTDGSFTYLPSTQIRHAAAAINAPEAATIDSFTVNASDAYGGVATATITVPVSPVNGNPAGGAITGLQIDDIVGVVTGSVTGVTDPDLDALSYSTSGASVGGGVVDVYDDGTFTYNPTADQRHLAAALGAPFAVTHDSFTIWASDGHGGSTAITIVVPVPPEVDEPPTGVAAG